MEGRGIQKRATPTARILATVIFAALHKASLVSARAYADPQREGDTEKAVMQFTAGRYDPMATTASSLYQLNQHVFTTTPYEWHSPHERSWGEDENAIGPYIDGDPNRPRPPKGYRDGPMPILSDSVFSLIILIYVSVIFIFMFFAFCWREPEPPPPDPAHKNIPMITSILDEMEKQEAENATQPDGQNGEEALANGANGEARELQDQLLIDVEVAGNPPSEGRLLQLELVNEGNGSAAGCSQVDAAATRL